MRRRWFAVGFVWALAISAVSQVIGLHPGKTSHPIFTAFVMMLIAVLSIFYALHDERIVHQNKEP